MKAVRHEGSKDGRQSRTRRSQSRVRRGVTWFAKDQSVFSGLRPSHGQPGSWPVWSQLDGKRPTRLRAGIGSGPAALEAAGMSRHAKRKSSKLRRPKTKLGLPDLDHSKSAVLDSLRSPDRKSVV